MENYSWTCYPHAIIAANGDYVLSADYEEHYGSINSFLEVSGDDAGLIVAAPDMLAALVRVQEWVETINPAHIPGFPKNDIDVAVMKATS